MSITPIQQLVSAQRIANVQIQSNNVFRNLSKVSILAGTLSDDNSNNIIDSLMSDNVLIENMDNNLIVAKYLLIKYSNSKQKVKLTCVQLKLAIIELKKQIELIKNQKDDKLKEELEWTKHLLHKLQHKYKKQCKKC